MKFLRRIFRRRPRYATGGVVMPRPGRDAPVEVRLSNEYVLAPQVVRRISRELAAQFDRYPRAGR